MGKRTFLVLILVVGMSVPASGARGAIVLFQGADPGVPQGGARPNSDAASTSFNVANAVLGPTQTVNFESSPIGAFISMMVGAGVTVTLSGVALTTADANGGISASPDTTLGYNTTAGGSRFLRIVPDTAQGSTATAQFSFATPVASFGAYFTGLGTASGNLTIQFNDGSNQSIPITGSSSGGVQFFGFTDAGKSISSVSAVLSNVIGSRDIYGIDDVRFALVPEPAGMTLLLLAGSALVSARRPRHRRAVAGA